MSLKEKNRSRQNIWVHVLKENKTKLNLNKKQNNNSFHTIDFAESKNNFNKIAQKKKTSPTSS